MFLTICLAAVWSRSLYDISITFKHLPTFTPFIININYSHVIDVHDTFRNYNDTFDFNNYSKPIAPFKPILLRFNPSLLEISNEIIVQFFIRLLNSISKPLGPISLPLTSKCIRH